MRKLLLFLLVFLMIDSVLAYTLIGLSAGQTRYVGDSYFAVVAVEDSRCLINVNGITKWVSEGHGGYIGNVNIAVTGVSAGFCQFNVLSDLSGGDYDNDYGNNYNDDDYYYDNEYYGSCGECGCDRDCPDYNDDGYIKKWYYTPQPTPYKHKYYYTPTPTPTYKHYYAPPPTPYPTPQPTPYTPYEKFYYNGPAGYYFGSYSSFFNQVNVYNQEAQGDKTVHMGNATSIQIIGNIVVVYI